MNSVSRPLVVTVRGYVSLCRPLRSPSVVQLYNLSGKSSALGSHCHTWCFLPAVQWPVSAVAFFLCNFWQRSVFNVAHGLEADRFFFLTPLKEVQIQSQSKKLLFALFFCSSFFLFFFTEMSQAVISSHCESAEIELKSPLLWLLKWIQLKFHFCFLINKMY